MNKQWTLHVEGFGKIREANVRITPLICFVGDNNSGKSYLMSLLWGILTLGKGFFPDKPSDGQAYRRCEEWLKAHINKEAELDEETRVFYIQWFNELLANNKKKLLRRIFNYDVEATKIEIQNYKRANKFQIRWEDNGKRFSATETYVKFPTLEEINRPLLHRINAYICWNLLMEGLAAPLFTPVVKGRRQGEPVYLPASRTGFMLTFPQLVDQSLQMSFSPGLEENSSALTLPYVDFLQLITKFETKKSLSQRERWALNYIEENITSGKISVKKDTLPVVLYQPENTEKLIPLYVSSSIVSEVSPLQLLFQSGINFKTLIIEEPEAHLHPALQQQMARFIINLVNRGYTVWITTHSDTILQHINSMLALKMHPLSQELMERFNYQPEDRLSADHVSMYQFLTTQHEKTLFQELQNTGNGFAVSSFNDALELLVKEVYAFQENDNA